MPHTPDPYVAFLSSLQDAYAASGGPVNAFTPGAQGVPGAGASAFGDPSGAVGGTLAGIGAGGASVPGTATTGSSLLESILSGQIPVDSPTATSLASLAFGGDREPSERGDLGAGVTGGDADLLMSILSGNPLLMVAMVAQAVSNQGVPQGFGVDATGGTSFQFGDSSSGLGFRDSGLNLGSNAGVNFNNNPLTNPVGGVSFGGGDSTSGASGRSGSRSETTSKPGGIGGV